MKRKNMFFGVTTVALLIASVFATKANRKNLQPTTVSYHKSGSTYGSAWIGASSSPCVTTTVTTNHTAFFSRDGVNYTLVTAVNHTKLYSTF